jgi:hypothetical protein
MALRVDFTTSAFRSRVVAKRTCGREPPSREA